MEEHTYFTLLPHIILLHFRKLISKHIISYSMDIKAIHLKLQEMRQSFFDEVSIFQTDDHISVY